MKIRNRELNVHSRVATAPLISFKNILAPLFFEIRTAAVKSPLKFEGICKSPLILIKCLFLFKVLRNLFGHFVIFST